MLRENASLPRPGGVRLPAALLASLAFSAAWLVPGCGTDAVGVEACRQIEMARCDVAPACVDFEGSPAIETEEQVKNCRIFYRDHCLLGLENVEADPGQGDVDACVEAIRRTAECGSPTQSTIAECGVVLREGADTTRAPCAILQAPHELSACSFLEEEASAGEGGAGATSTATATTTADAASTSTGDAAVASTSTGALVDDGH